MGEPTDLGLHRKVAALEARIATLETRLTAQDDELRAEIIDLRRNLRDAMVDVINTAQDAKDLGIKVAAARLGVDEIAPASNLSPAAETWTSGSRSP